MAKDKKAAVAATLALSLSDSWLTDNLPSAGSVNAQRMGPSMPHLSKIELLTEEDQNGKCNGANLVLSFSEGHKATKAKAAVSELWVSREINLEQDGKYSFPAIIVTRACGLRTDGQLGATSNAVSLRFGKQGDGDDTYFAYDVPSNASLDKLMADAVKAVNANDDLLKDFQTKGWIKSIPGKEKTDRVTHLVEFPASKIGYTPMLFCPIGKDGHPIVDPFSDNWSSTRNKGTGWLFNWTTDEQGNQIAVPAPDRTSPNKQARRTFRGQTFKFGTRSEQVAKNLLAQIKANPVWAKIQAISAQPFQERQSSRKVGERPRFVPMGPKAMNAPQEGTAPVSAQPVENPADLSF